MTTSITPPSVSPAFFAASTTAIIAPAPSGSRHRTGEASNASASSGKGIYPEVSTASPSERTCDTTLIPATSRLMADARAPSATRAAVSRAEARSRTGRASSKPYLFMPVRSAWPGRGFVSGRLRATSRSSPVPASTRREAEGTGSGDITVSHLGHSEFPISSATGEPIEIPCRNPERTVSSSCSHFWRAPRPYPARRRASAARTSSLVRCTPAGTPSMRAIRARPWDSPAVLQRNIAPIV